MAPINNESRKTKVNGVKWIRSILRVPKRKEAGEKEKYINYEDNVCDAVPGPPREENYTSINDSIPYNVNIGSQRANNDENSEDEQTKPKIEEIFDEEQKCNVGEEFNEKKNPNLEEESDEELKYKNRRQQRFSNNSGGYPKGGTQNNMYVTGKNIHIGPETTSYYYIGCGNPNQRMTPKNLEKSEAVKVLLKSKQKVESSHLVVLSENFDNEWRKIGLELLFTEGQIQQFKLKHKERKEASFQMLSTWCSDQENTTIGQLCRALWDTKLENAIKAVNILSMKIHLC
uniref:Death domain-containing protein n=1 Tax=Cuerna arida TaxID=1464854 RepID=A0A1B6G8G0_9HEMI